MAQNRQYRYFAKPIGDNTNEMLAAKLSALNVGFDTETQSITVDGKKILGVYQVTHIILTELSHSEKHRGNIRAYVQEGEGEIRPYKFFVSKLRASINAKEMERVDTLLAAMKNARPYAARPKTP
jgi:hypothetical protein